MELWKAVGVYRRSMLRPRSRPDHRIARIDASGLVAVILVLAMVFWAYDIFMTNPHRAGWRMGRFVNARILPGARRDDAINVFVNRDSAILCAGRWVRSRQELSRLLRQSAKPGTPRTVYIYAMGRARYRWVEEVLDSAREAGFQNVAFVTSKE